ncbi:MAG: hypothetical protein ACOYYF_10705 [Chloroflexota bacterium]|nr:hypothetical protein [Chloroflexota bacterium]
MNKRCFLVGRKDSLFKQLVASLLVDMMDDLDLYENKAVEFDALLEEIKIASPHLLLLEEASPFSENSLMTRFLANLPALPVVVISEDSNLIYVVRCNARLLSSSRDLIEAIHLTFDHHFNPNKENVL